MFTTTVRPDDGEPYDLVVTSRDVLSWEQSGRGRRLGSLADAQNLSIIDIYALAFRAAVRRGLFDGDIRDFQDTCDVSDLRETKPEDHTGPTRPDR